MDCPKCHIPMMLIEHILDEVKMTWIKITSFYKCNNCKEEYYDLDKLETK